MHSLIEAAVKKAAVAWLAVPGGGAAYPVWCVWSEDALLVVTGPGEQSAPGLADLAGGTGTITVTLAGDHGGRVVGWPATATLLAVTDEAWEPAATALAGKRLNAVGSAEETVARWRADCRIVRIVPAGEPDEAGPTLPNGNLAAPVRQSAATRLPRRPKRFHRVRGESRSTTA